MTTAELHYTIIITAFKKLLDVNTGMSINIQDKTYFISLNENYELIIQELPVRCADGMIEVSTNIRSKNVSHQIH